MRGSWGGGGAQLFISKINITNLFVKGRSYHWGGRRDLICWGISAQLTEFSPRGRGLPAEHLALEEVQLLVAHLSHNQNPANWLTQNHVKYEGGRNYLWLGLALSNLHCGPGETREQLWDVFIRGAGERGGLSQEVGRRLGFRF